MVRPSIQLSAPSLSLPETTTYFKPSRNQFSSPRRFKCELIYVSADSLILNNYFRILKQESFSVQTFCPSVKFRFAKNDEKKSTRIEINWPGSMIFNDFSLLHPEYQRLTSEKEPLMNQTGMRYLLGSSNLVSLSNKNSFQFNSFNLLIGFDSRKLSNLY